MLSIITNGTNLHLIEAFQGLPLHKFTVREENRPETIDIDILFQDIVNDREEPLQCCFSPDSSYILCGTLQPTKSCMTDRTNACLQVQAIIAF